MNSSIRDARGAGTVVRNWSGDDRAQIYNLLYASARYNRATENPADGVRVAALGQNGRGQT
jgi:hypothetical protein